MSARSIRWAGVVFICFVFEMANLPPAQKQNCKKGMVGMSLLLPQRDWKEFPFFPHGHFLIFLDILFLGWQEPTETSLVADEVGLAWRLVLESRKHNRNFKEHDTKNTFSEAIFQVLMRTKTEKIDVWARGPWESISKLFTTKGICNAAMPAAASWCEDWKTQGSAGCGVDGRWGSWCNCTKCSEDV